MASVRLLSLLLESDDDEEESDVAAAESARWVAWVSLDPRGSHPHLSVYPGSVARMIEEARRKGETSVCLGEAFFGASIHLGARPEQRTRSGRRDARRIVLPAQGGEAVLRVYETPRSWRVAEPHMRGIALEARVDIPPECVVDLTRIDELLEQAAAAAAASDAVPGSRRLRVEPVPEAMEALWEWCHALRVTHSESASLPPSAWGVYSEEQNALIEQALHTGGAGSRCAVTVGVREYEVVFGSNPNFASQVDKRLHKSRLVRRRVVSRAEYKHALTPPTLTTTRGEDTCALCAEKFVDTAAMPLVELPGCLHVFHQACAQQLVDESRPCRRRVDW